MCVLEMYPLTRSAGTEHHLFSYEDTKEVLRTQIFLARDHQVELRTCVEGWHTSHALHTDFCNDVYGSVRHYAQRSTVCTAFWNDCTNDNSPPSPEWFQSAEETTTTLKSNAIVAFSVHVVVLDFITGFSRLLIDKRYAFVRWLPVYTFTDEYEEPEEQI